MGNKPLNKAILEWGKINKPDWYGMVPGKNEDEGIFLEILVKDEEEPGEIAGFINSLPDD